MIIHGVFWLAATNILEKTFGFDSKKNEAK